MALPADFRDHRAVLSPCGRYRYWLRRPMLNLLPPVAFLMLNPSTADATDDDPTIRRCLGYARDWGLGDLIVVNLFAWRSTNPNELYLAADPVGPDNDDAIVAAVELVTAAGGKAVAAWGNHGALRDRGERVLDMLASRGLPINVLRVTSTGQPNHPLYLPRTLKPAPFTGRP